MQEKFGFIYIWRDKKHNRYYIGSHWGTEDDGYICSSRWMNKAYKRRPNDFKRRIISRVTSSRKDLLLEEQRWMDFIKPEEVKIRYYNLNLRINDYWHTYENSRLTISEKISIKTKEKWNDPEFRAKMDVVYESRKGSKASSETVAKKSASMKAKMAEKFPIEDRRIRLERDSEQLRQVYSERSKRLWANRTEEEKAEIGAKITQANLGKKNRLGQKNTDEHRAKISAAQKGKTLSAEHIKNMSKPRSRKWTPEMKAAHAERIRLSWEKRRNI